VNRALMRRLKLRPAEIVGKLCEEVLPQHAAWKNCPYCLKDEKGLSEHPDPCLGGFSLVSTSSYREHGQERRGTIHVIRDTSARRAAEEKYRMLFEQAQEGVFVADPKGKLLDCNDAFVRMLGYSSRDELMALHMDNGVYTSTEQRESIRIELEVAELCAQFRSGPAAQRWNSPERDGKQFCHARCRRTPRTLPGLPDGYFGEAPGGRRDSPP